MICGEEADDGLDDPGGKRPYGNLPQQTPDDWTFAGRGDHRVVYFAPTGEVYKVGRDRVNSREHGVLQILASHSELVSFLPKYSFYDFSVEFDQTGWSYGDTVVAMEFVADDGSEPDKDDLARLNHYLEKYEVSDHPENVRVRGGRPDHH